MLFFKQRVMHINSIFYIRTCISCSNIQQLCRITQYLIKTMNLWSIMKQGDGAETVFKVRKHISKGILVSYFDEINVRMDAIVETTQVYEINRIVTIILQFSNLTCACINQVLPEVNRVFSLLSSLCIKTFGISSKITALTSLPLLSAYILSYQILYINE